VSRVEEEREAARAAERLLLKQRQDEQRQKERALTETRFSERLASQTAQRTKAAESATQHKEQQQSADNSVHLEQRVEDAGRSAEQTKESLESTRARRWLAERADRWKGQSEAETAQTATTHQSEDVAAADTAHGRSSDEGTTSERGDSRKKSSDAQSDAMSQGKAKGKDDLSADADGNKGGGGEGNKKNSRDGDNPGASFRLNPALMAPVAVAKPREKSGSERLRALANEIAQKIVERVRIGTNAAGVAEFQIELRSNVMSGLNIHVSGSKGRIEAVFSGRDSKVLKLLREQADALKQTLESRGIKLAEIRVEEKP
jgi:hypothetical protein